jgi:hypothetical protein
VSVSYWSGGAASTGSPLVHDHPLAEHQLVDLFGLGGVGEVVGESGPDELVPTDSGELGGGLVGVMIPDEQTCHACEESAARESVPCPVGYG